MKSKIICEKTDDVVEILTLLRFYVCNVNISEFVNIYKILMNEILSLFGL